MPPLDAPVTLTPIASKVGRKHREEERKTWYKDFEVRLCWTGKGSTHPPLTLEQVKEILDLETEPEYKQRMMKENPKLKEDKIKFPGHVQVMKNPAGIKFVCWNNVNNRRFRESDCLRLAYEFLDERWAGPGNFPGETVNGEPVRVTRTRFVFDGQHRLIAYYFACLIALASPKYGARWVKPIPFETVLMLGVSDAKSIYDTVDNTIPRSLADNIYTSDTYRDLTEDQRWECSKMQASALDFLWKRTGADLQGEGQSYRSLVTAESFLKNHPKLQTCIRWLFDCNNVGEDGTACISLLHLSPGICAGALFLMGSCLSDAGEYRKGDKEGNRRDKGLNWDSFDKGKEFFAELTKEDCGQLVAVKDALVALESDEGSTGNTTEKMAVLSLAWHQWLTGEKVSLADLDLSTYVKISTSGKPFLDNPPTFGNLDLGPKPDLKPPVDVEAEARKEREKAAREAAEKIEKEQAEAQSNGKPAPKKGKKEKKKEGVGSAPTSAPAQDQAILEDVRKEHPGKVLLFKGSKLVNVWGADIETVRKVFPEKPIRLATEGETTVASWPIDRTAEIVAELKTAGHKVGEAMKHKSGGVYVEDR